jgi:hypothetical protein
MHAQRVDEVKLARSTLGVDFARLDVKPNYRGDVSHLGVNRTATQTYYVG